MEDYSEFFANMDNYRAYLKTLPPYKSRSLLAKEKNRLANILNHPKLRPEPTDADICLRCGDANYLVECKCGCGRILGRKDNDHRYREFFPGHSTRLWDQKAEKSPSWKGGTYVNGWGYVLRMHKGHPRGDKNGYVFEHILNFEDANKCCVLVWGNIHHKDHNKRNNSPANLEGMTSSQHTKIMNAERVYTKWNEESKAKIRDRPRDWHGRLLSTPSQIVKDAPRWSCPNCKDMNYLIECACGCGGIRGLTNRNYVRRSFIKYHRTRLPNNPK